MSTQTPRLLALATAVPDEVLPQAAVAAAAREIFAGAPGGIERLMPVFDNAAIALRRSCVPLAWYRAPHDFAERNRLYAEHAVALLERAAAGALAEAGIAPAEVDLLLTVSSTGIATPTLDALLMDRLPFRRDVERLPVFGLGCAGGVLGLGRAAALALARPASRVLLLTVELCGLTFRRHDASKSNFVASALFGDGAAAALIGCAEAGPALTGWGEHTWPNSREVMGWQVDGDGLGVVFSREIPQLIRKNLRPVLDGFLSRHGLGLGDIDAFIAHPGGARVLEALEVAFELPPGGLGWARRVLAEHGNMSAPSVLFVLAEALRRRRGQGRPLGRALLSALGPGFTAGFALLEEPGAG